MNSETFYVTHYIPDRYPETGLRVCEFLTARNPEGATEFFMGFDTARVFSQRDIESRVNGGLAVRLPIPAEIKPSEGVWVDKDRSVWVADYENPLKDKSRRKVS